MATEEVTLLIRLNDQVSAGVEKLKSTWSGSFTEMNQKIELLKTGFSVATRVMQGMQGAAAFEAQSQAFGQMVDKLGMDADQLVKSMKSAAHGAISTAEAIAAGTRSIALGIDPEKLGQLMAIARSSSIQTGVSVTQMFDSLTLAIGRQSKMVLDNLLIIIDVGQANKNYAEAMGIVGRSLTEIEAKQAFLNEALRVGVENMEKMGEMSTTSSEKLAASQIAMEKATMELKIALLPLLTTIAEGWTPILTAVSKVIAALGALTRLNFAPLLKILNDVGNTIMEVFVGTSLSMYEWGEAAGNKFADGFSAAWEAAKDAVVGLIPDTLKKWLKQESPAEMGPLDTYRWGFGAAKLYAGGLRAGTGQVQGAVAELTDGVKKWFAAGTGALGDLMSGNLSGAMMQAMSSAMSIADDLIMGKWSSKTAVEKGQAIGAMFGPIGATVGGWVGKLFEKHKSEGGEWRDSFKDMFKDAGISGAVINLGAYKMAWSEIGPEIERTQSVYLAWAQVLGVEEKYQEQAAKIMAASFSEANLTLWEQADAMGAVIASSKGLSQFQGDLIAVQTALWGAYALTNDELAQTIRLGREAWALDKQQQAAQEEFQKAFEVLMTAPEGSSEYARALEDIKHWSQVQADLTAAEAAEIEELREQGLITDEQIESMSSPAERTADNTADTADNTSEMLKIMCAQSGDPGEGWKLPAPSPSPSPAPAPAPSPSPPQPSGKKSTIKQSVRGYRDPLGGTVIYNPA